MTYQEIDWTDFQRKFRWRQGEHVVAVAPTGGGKTTLLSKIADMRRCVCVMVSKTYDDSFRRFDGYERITHWPPKRWQDKVLLWPRPEKSIRETVKVQREVFQEALDAMWTERNWTIIVDEEHYAATKLGLGDDIATLLHQGRSSGITMVNGTQRPAWVPVVTYSSASHGFLWRTTDAKDLDRLANLGGIDKRELRDNLLSLGKHDFIYVPAIDGGRPIRTRVRL